MPKKCADCQKNIPPRPFTTHVEALYCNACNKAHDVECERDCENLEHAIARYPGLGLLGYGEASSGNHLVGARPDLHQMEERTTFVVFSDCDEDDNPRILVFDTESEGLAKEKVKSDPTVKNYFEREIIAMKSCIQKLTQR